MRSPTASVARCLTRNTPTWPGRPLRSWRASDHHLYAVGQVNFLFDRSQEPHTTPDELSAAFGVSKSTMSSKAKQVRDLLKMGHFSAEFQRAARIAQNPAIWFVQVDGMIVDARSIPVELQVEAYRLGVIPYVPALGPDGTPSVDSLLSWMDTGTS